jgi:hypothetical protein
MKNDIPIRNKRLAQQKAAKTKGVAPKIMGYVVKLVRGLNAIRCKTNVHKICVQK